MQPDRTGGGVLVIDPGGVQMNQLAGPRNDTSKFISNRMGWRVKSSKQSWDKTAFSSFHSLFRLAHMLFGLENMPKMLRISITVLLRNAKWQIAVIYLDKISILRDPRANVWTMLDKYAIYLQGWQNIDLKALRNFPNWLDKLGHAICPERR